MVYSDTATRLGIVEQADFNVFGSSNANTDEYPLADKARHANRWYRIVMAWIFEYAGNWSFDDSNYTNLPFSRGNCVSGQNDYTFPADYVDIEGVSYKDANGIWHKLIPLDAAEIGVGVISGSVSGQVSGVGAQDREEFLKADGTPIYYDKLGNSYWLYPAPNRDSSDGDSLRVYHTRDASLTGTTSGTAGPFIAADTTKEPGFNRLWHPVLAAGMAYDFALGHSVSPGMQQKMIDMFAETEKYRLMIQTHYARRKKDERQRIVPRSQNNR